MRTSIFKYTKSVLLHASKTALACAEIMSDDDLPVISNPETFNFGIDNGKVDISFHSGEVDRNDNIHAINFWLSTSPALRTTDTHDLYIWNCERVEVRYFVWRKS